MAPERCTSSLRNDEDVMAAIGCEKLELIQPDIRFMVSAYAALNRFINEWEQRHGPDAKVRIVIDWVLAALHGTGISYDELAVVTATYSKIGSKTGPVRITREKIWWRSLGYKSEHVFKEETDGYGFSRTARQVRDLIDRLAPQARRW